MMKVYHSYRLWFRCCNIWLFLKFVFFETTSYFSRSFHRYLLTGVCFKTVCSNKFNIKYGYAILPDQLYTWGFLILRNGSMWSVERKPKFTFVSFIPLDYESSLSWFFLFICLFKALPTYLKQVQNVKNLREELNTF